MRYRNLQKSLHVTRLIHSVRLPPPPPAPPLLTFPCCPMSLHLYFAADPTANLTSGGTCMQRNPSQLPLPPHSSPPPHRPLPQRFFHTAPCTSLPYKGGHVDAVQLLPASFPPSLLSSPSPALAYLTSGGTCMQCDSSPSSSSSSNDSWLREDALSTSCSVAAPSTLPVREVPEEYKVWKVWGWKRG